jgi:hypothetical protein
MNTFAQAGLNHSRLPPPGFVHKDAAGFLCSIVTLRWQDGPSRQLMAGTPSSMHIFRTKFSLISLCLGSAVFLFNTGLCQIE